MRTESINQLLESLFDKKDVFSDEELDSVSSINISRMSFVGTLFDVDFSDLDYFRNLSDISIDGCMIDKKAMESIIKHEKLNSISFCNCDVLGDTYPYFQKLQTQNISFINTRVDLSKITGYYDCVKIENMMINELNAQGSLLDVTNSLFRDIDVIVTAGFKTLKVSHKQYLEYQLILDKCGKNVIVMEENGQFISKEVNRNG